VLLDSSYALVITCLRNSIVLSTMSIIILEGDVRASGRTQVW